MEQPSSSSGSPVPPATPPVPATSLSGRLLNIFATPGDVFEEVKAGPASAANWLAPAFVFIILSWLSAWLVFSQDSVRQQLRELTNKGVEQQIERTKATGERADQMRETSEKVAGLIYKIGAVAGPVLVAFALPFWWGLILWLVGTKALKGSFPYMKAVEVSGLATTILCLDTIVRTLLVLLTGNLFAAPSLVLLVKDYDPQNTIHGLLALVNVMVFWVLAIRSIGLARLSGASTGKSLLWVFGIWFSYTGLLFGFGVAMKALGKAMQGG